MELTRFWENQENDKIVSDRIQTLRDSQSQDLDKQFQKHHQEVFKKTDCLSCAHCCRNYSPILKVEDINRIGKKLDLSFEELVDTYIEMDEEGDFVFRTQPCPMLNLETNKCNVYEDRPESCRSYPHTNMENIKEHLDLLETNARVCPAAFEILEEVAECSIK